MFRTGVLVMVVLALASAEAFAQTKPRPPRTPKWTFEMHAGGLIGQGPGGGSAIEEFPRGDVFSTSFPVEVPAGPPSRAVSSWFFGDGAVLFNQMQSQSPVPANLRFPPITPLDDMLRSAAARRHGGPTFGFRFTRTLGPRYALEFGFDQTLRPFKMTDSAAAAVEATRSSFERSFAGLIAVMPQVNSRVSATAQFGDKDGRETTFSGALVVTIADSPRLAVRAVGGAGMLFNTTADVELRLVGNYRFTTFELGTINESDTVIVAMSDRSRITAGVIGGSLDYKMGARHGLRFEVRALVSGNGNATSVTATPSAATSTPTTFATPTNPTVQFSTRAGARTSLSGGTIPDLRTFTGSGLDIRTHLTVGYFIRF